ncbi:MAG TPA: RNA-binding S4 domain-containing protein [Firmicutes bacterium]|nr:RNA-binding S4 domain-containing protein [Bacillota bacterium]
MPGQPGDETISVKEVYIRQEPIQLGQFLKLAGAVYTGGEAKELIQAGLVTINGETETRRSRQLQAGDLVAVQNRGCFKLVGNRPANTRPAERERGTRRPS